MRLLTLIRCLKYLALLLVALSTLAQLAGLALAHLALGPPILPALRQLIGLTAFALVPGMLLAFVLSVYYGLWSFERLAARFKALALLAIAFLPFAGPSVVVPDGQLAPPAEIQVIADAEAESQQFLAGRDWAAAHQPRSDAECPGSTDFRYGCEAAILARANAHSEGR